MYNAKYGKTSHKSQFIAGFSLTSANLLAKLWKQWLMKNIAIILFTSYLELKSVEYYVKKYFHLLLQKNKILEFNHKIPPQVPENET